MTAAHTDFDAMPRFHDPRAMPGSAPQAHGDDSAASRKARRTFSIGDLARDFGVTLRALRFYESKGLLVPRRRGTTRLYTQEDRTRLATILQGKEFGFSLRQIKDMLSRRTSPGTAAALALSADSVAEQIAQLEAQKSEIERALAGLRDLEARPSH